MVDPQDQNPPAEGSEACSPAGISGPRARSVRVDALSALAPNPERIQRRRLATAAREVIAKLVVTTAGADDLADAGH